MDIFNSKAKEKAIQELENVSREYVSTGRLVNIEAQSLYNQKKKAVKAIEKAEKTLKKQQDLDIDSIRRIADAKSSVRLFQEAVQNEQIEDESINGSTGGIVGAGVAGAATGVAVATIGPTAAMALATTFGTTATGTAISALGGAAATNAALAWLGGGALAVGGGGMSAGSAVLAMFGPIGWAVGGITVGTAGLLALRKNKQIVNQANKQTKKAKSITRKLKDTIKGITALREDLIKDTSILNALMEGIPSEDGQIKYNYPKIVETIESLCKSINKKFPV